MCVRIETNRCVNAEFERDMERSLDLRIRRYDNAEERS